MKNFLKNLILDLQNSDFNLETRIKEMLDAIIEQEVESCPEVDHFLRFLRNAERGICRGRKESND